MAKTRETVEEFVAAAAPLLLAFEQYIHACVHDDDLLKIASRDVFLRAIYAFGEGTAEPPKDNVK